eukprot:NODE_668_length_4888_cov_0.964293.p4 type:complete len:106 gc:universal NODE_668_length_4888_cov_0.964293:3733-4050(+)
MIQNQVICIYLVVTRVFFKTTTRDVSNNSDLTLKNDWSESSTSKNSITLSKFHYNVKLFEINWNWQMITRLEISLLLIVSLLTRLTVLKRKKTSNKPQSFTMGDV